MAQHERKNPAPIVKDERLPVAYSLMTQDGTAIKFPHRSSKSRLVLLRFTAPNHAHPNGQVIAAGYPPFDPAKLGLSLIRRY